LSYITGNASCLSLSHAHILIIVIGWLCALGWQTALVASSFLAGTIIQSLLILNHPTTYNPKPFHGTLFCIMFVFIGVLFNTFLARKLPLVEGILVISHMLGIVILIPLLVFSPRRAGTTPFTEFFNYNGWSTMGVAVWVGMMSTLLSALGFDCAIHMGESDLLCTMCGFW
jgi:amino acid transporter